MLEHMNKREQDIINSLLEKHALGICTPEESALLEQWYAAFPEEGEVWRDATEKAAMKETLKAGIFDVIAQEKVHPITSVPVKASRRIWWQAAAVVAVLVGTWLLYNKFSHKKEPEYVVVSAAAGKGILKVQLPDQSEVWLEPGTTVRYRKDLGNVDREIELADGMAFFSVRKHAKLPFLVKTPGGVQTKVLGTEFTVKAYTQSDEVQVMVSEGTVQVSDSTYILGILTANQQISYLQHAHGAKRTEGALEDWRAGGRTFSNASFAEVARILETRYGLQVAFNAADVASYRFNFRISKHTSALEMLEMLKDISGLAYTFNDNKVTIH
jgi:ferric-dicitrate binding protein FerR (iron transport regulator)